MNSSKRTNLHVGASKWFEIVPFGHRMHLEERNAALLPFAVPSDFNCVNKSACEEWATRLPGEQLSFN
jgi:hypothetical protein